MSEAVTVAGPAADVVAADVVQVVVTTELTMLESGTVVAEDWELDVAAEEAVAEDPVIGEAVAEERSFAPKTPELLIALPTDFFM